MKIATWNVNSIRAREERLLAWLEREQPDVSCLQELKVTDEDFPFDELDAAGYHAAVFGQKTYNGVAILSRSDTTNVRRGMDDGVDDPQARLIQADVGGVRFVNGYFPNGKEVGSPKYEYKIAWMKRLVEHLQRTAKPSDDLVLCGDFNVAPYEDDVANPEKWQHSVLCHHEAREALEAIRDWGFTDVFRVHHPGGGVYSWWDYRMLGFPKGDGLRIDHIYATESVATRCSGARVDRDERKGKKPSDHAPVIAEIEEL
jgi:exodeoxyribonuclease-3